jgi:ACS family D-galactonate transporter-like MFS transporter
MQKDSLRSWLVIVLLGIALTISQMDRMLLSIAAPTMMSEQHISGTALGILLSSFAWTYTFLQLPSGWLVDRFGAKLILGLAFVFWSLACAMTGLASTFAVLIACRLTLGAAEAPFYPAAHSTMAHAFSDRRRGLATAIYTKGASLGPALGAIVGSWLLLKYGWSHMFIVVGLVSLVFMIPWMLVVPHGMEGTTSKSEKVSWATMKELLDKRAVWGVSLGYFGFLYLYHIYIKWLPTYLAKSRGLSTAQIAWMASVPFLISLIAGPLSGFIADWLIGRGYSQTVVRKSAIGIGLLLGSAVILAVFVHDAQTAAILFVVALAGQSISATSMLSLPSAIAPKGHAGFIGAFQQMLGSMGAIVAPIVTGILYDKNNDFESAILCAGAMLVLAAVSFIIILPRIEPIRLSGDSHPTDDAVGLPDVAMTAGRP